MVTSSEYGVLKIDSTRGLFSGAGPLSVTTELVAAFNGFDVVYRIVNPTSTAQPLPTLTIYGLQFGPSVDYLLLPLGTTFRTLQWRSGLGVETEMNPYPTTRFAPVSVMRDTDSRGLAVGGSIKYPVLEYKHAVTPRFTRYGDMSDNWMFNVGLSGSIDAGESRVYTATLRFEHKDNWIHTLEPYRDYFWGRYGTRAHYAQDLRPIKGQNVAVNERIDPDLNPRGMIPMYTGLGIFRVDQVGWRYNVDWYLHETSSGGFKRLMLWVPSGLYYDPIYYRSEDVPQFPFLMMTNWTPPMLATQDELLRIPAAGVELGFWWGNSATVQFEWNPLPERVFELDPNNPAHVAAADDQLSLAAARGATFIGLDSFRLGQLWKMAPWLERLKSTYPNLRFTSEPNSSDILLMLAPYTTDSSNLPLDPLIADYLVPGREISVIFRIGVDTLENAVHYTGWGLTTISYVSGVSADGLMPYIEQARNGWAIDPYLPPPDGSEP